MKQRSFTFNRPWALLLTLPLVLLLTMLVMGLAMEFNGLALFFLVFTLILLLPIVYLGFFRRIRFSTDKVEWITPTQRSELSKDSIRHFGIIKYRAFKFIYISSAQEEPFLEADARLVPTHETFLFQYRKSAWTTVDQWLKGIAQRHDLNRK